MSACGMMPSQLAADPAFAGEFAPITGSTVYAPERTARPTNLTVYLGDSITIGLDDFNGLQQGESFATYASLLSGQRIRKLKNAGVAGNTSAQMLARFDTDVAPLLPGTVHLLAGTNDMGVIQLDQFQVNIRALVAKIRGIRAVPVLGTIPPNTAASPANRKAQIVQFNAWLRTYCANDRITLIDYYGLLVDAATAGWKAAYPSPDGIHPGSAGRRAMGNLLSDRISELMPPLSVPLCADDVDESNLLLKGCFGGYSGSTLPTAYTDNGGTTGVTISYTTDALVQGQLLTLTSSAGVLRELTTGWSIGAAVLTGAVAAGAATVSVSGVNPVLSVLFLGSGANAEVARVASVTGSGPYVATLTHVTAYAHAAGEACVVNALPGDVVASSGIYTSDGGVAFSAKLVFTPPTTTNRPLDAIPAAITRGIWYSEHAIPAGTTQMFFRPAVAAGTGVTSFGQVGVYNLTRLGALDD